MFIKLLKFEWRYHSKQLSFYLFIMLFFLLGFIMSYGGRLGASELVKSNFQLETGKVSDRTDGKLVHLDGVNFSRAWSLNTIAKDITEYWHLTLIANQHINYSLPNIVEDSYEGGHWLGSFAIYALNTVQYD